MPNDPIVNDHYGDILWKLNRKIQAKYYWKSVIESEESEDDMKKNETLTYKNIIMKRPGLGINGFEIKKIIGKKVRKNIKKETQISLKDFFIL